MKKLFILSLSLHEDRASCSLALISSPRVPTKPSISISKSLVRLKKGKSEYTEIFKIRNQITKARHWHTETKQSHNSELHFSCYKNQFTTTASPAQSITKAHISSRNMNETGNLLVDIPSDNLGEGLEVCLDHLLTRNYHEHIFMEIQKETPNSIR